MRHKLAEQSSHRQVAIIRKQLFAHVSTKRWLRWIIQTLLLRKTNQTRDLLVKEENESQGQLFEIGAWNQTITSLMCLHNSSFR